MKTWLYFVFVRWIMWGLGSRIEKRWLCEWALKSAFSYTTFSLRFFMSLVFFTSIQCPRMFTAVWSFRFEILLKCNPFSWNIVFLAIGCLFRSCACRFWFVIEPTFFFFDTFSVFYPVSGGGGGEEGQVKILSNSMCVRSGQLVAEHTANLSFICHDRLVSYLASYTSLHFFSSQPKFWIFRFWHA